jgi:spore coat polysaccharide biosynthesis protein SpsF
LKTVAIIQARLASSRLPGKVLLPIAQQPMLARVVSRVRRASLIDEIIVATTSDFSDEQIVQFCGDEGVPCYRGDPYDVLDRYYQAARQTQADIIVRITADCPMIDPVEIDRVIRAFLDNGVDFAANRLPPPFKRTTPIGMDTEVCTFSALERAWREADQPYQREHVMPYLYDTAGRFKVLHVIMQPDLGNLRFTVDTPEDLQLANEIYAAFGGRDDFTLQELLEENKKNPHWQQEVALVQHKNLYDVDSRGAASKEGCVKPVCPLCSQSVARLLEEVDSFGFIVPYYLCGNCGIVFQDNNQSQASDPDFYQETYRKIYQASPEPTKKDLYQQTQRAQNQATWLHSLDRQKFDRILDIGASSGILLDTFRHSFNAQVVGVEPGDAYRNLANSRNIAMYRSIGELIASNPQPFDLVTLMHVLEHLENPITELVRIRERLLADDGLLLVEVPNFYVHDSYELAHLSCFTAHTLEQMLLQAGFEPIASRKHGLPRSKTLNLYLTALSKPSRKPIPASVQPETRVVLKRKAGMLKRKLLTRLRPKASWLPLEGEK